MANKGSSTLHIFFYHSTRCIYIQNKLIVDANDLILCILVMFVVVIFSSTLPFSITIFSCLSSHCIIIIIILCYTNTLVVFVNMVPKVYFIRIYFYSKSFDLILNKLFYIVFQLLIASVWRVLLKMATTYVRIVHNSSIIWNLSAIFLHEYKVKNKC